MGWKLNPDNNDSVSLTAKDFRQLERKLTRVGGTYNEDGLEVGLYIDRINKDGYLKRHFRKEFTGFQFPFSRQHGSLGIREVDKTNVSYDKVDPFIMQFISYAINNDENESWGDKEIQRFLDSNFSNLSFKPYINKNNNGGGSYLDPGFLLKLPCESEEQLVEATKIAVQSRENIYGLLRNTVLSGNDIGYFSYRRKKLENYDRSFFWQLIPWYDDDGYTGENSKYELEYEMAFDKIREIYKREQRELVEKYLSISDELNDAFENLNKDFGKL